jgi:Ca-activated chloride channel homolog
MIKKLYVIIILFFPLINTFSDGFIVVPEHIIPFPLEVKYHYVDVTINDEIATTNIDQVFYNSTGQRLEGFYYFPVPKDAVIKKFSMYINGKETEAELLDATKARNIYEDIIRRQKDPALLEYSDRNMFKVRIFPIEPNSEKRLKISYSEVLIKDNNTFEYIYPLNTEKFSSKNLSELKINVNIKSSKNLKSVYCTTHNADILRPDNNSSKISYNEKNSKPDTDFKLYFSNENSEIAASLITYKNPADEKGFFYVNLSPGIEEKNVEIDEKDITFVLDTSGSMSGEKMEQAKKALLFCLNNLNINDRFEIIRFSTETESLFGDLKKSSDKNNVDKAKKFINNLKAIGGTNIDEALKLALGNEKDKNRIHFIIFITDGKPTIGETDENKLVKSISDTNISNTRIFTFGIGFDLNTHLLDKITELTNAYRTYITPEEDIEIKISNFYTKIQSPVLADVSINIKGVNTLNIYPKKIPDLFAGSSINLLGQYDGFGKSNIILEGKIKNQKKTYEYKVTFPENNTKDESIPALWAARRIGILLDRIRLHGEEKELVEETTFLARKYGIITPYTSYLILEDENTRTNRNELEERHQTITPSMKKEEAIIKRSKNEYEDLKIKSGEKSVQQSRELQSLNAAANIKEMKQGESRLDYKDSFGNTKNITSQVKNIQGRAFYRNGNNWVDSNIQSIKKGNVEKIKFATTKYFELLSKNPDISIYLSLGKNINFVHNNKIYEIYE